VKSAAAGARAPEPTIRIELDDFTPAVYNDAKLAKKTAALFKEIIGEKNVQLSGPIMGGEDFSRYGREGVPIFFYFMGTSDPQRVAESRKPGGTALAAMHSDTYYPEIEPSIRTGITTMSCAVLNLLTKSSQ
jgi:hippurate hydrolase